MSRFRLRARSGPGGRPPRQTQPSTQRGAGWPDPQDDPRGHAYARLASLIKPLRSVAVILDASLPRESFPIPAEVFDDAAITVFLLGATGPSDSEDKDPDGQDGDDDVNDPALGLDPSWEVVPLERPRQLHVALTGLGPFDVLIDHGPRARIHKLLNLANLLGHVRAGGAYVVDDLGAVRDESVTDRDGENVLEFALRMSQLVSTPDAFPNATKRDLALASTIDSVELGRDLATIRMRLDVRNKVRHGELRPIVRRRTDTPWSRGIRRVPRAEVVSNAIGYQNDDKLRDARYPEVIDVPRLLAREYSDVLARPAQVLEKDGLILPDSFRLWRAEMLTTTRLADTSRDFVLPSKQAPATERLSGQYYWVDSEYPRHFGHLMTEVLGRLWAWPEAKQENPRLKLLTSSLLPFQEEIFAAFGIERDDIVTFDHPVRVESLVAAMPAFHIGSYVSPDVIGETYARLQRGIPRAPSPAGERVFLTRERGLWRECVNADAVEDYFAERGFAVLRPEKFSLPEQAALFRDAKVVAGFLGSQLYCQVFSPDPLDVIGFVNTSYTSNNEYLLATALGHTLHQFWCPERTGRDKDITGRPLTTMHADYEFDFDRDSAALSALVDRL